MKYPISTVGAEVEVDYRYLGVHAGNRLDFLKKLRSIAVCSKMFHIFYESVVESVVPSAVICSIRASDSKKVDHLK